MWRSLQGQAGSAAHCETSYQIMKAAIPTAHAPNTIATTPAGVARPTMPRTRTTSPIMNRNTGPVTCRQTHLQKSTVVSGAMSPPRTTPPPARCTRMSSLAPKKFGANQSSERDGIAACSLPLIWSSESVGVIGTSTASKRWPAARACFDVIRAKGPASRPADISRPGCVSVTRVSRLFAASKPSGARTWCMVALEAATARSDPSGTFQRRSENPLPRLPGLGMPKVGEAAQSGTATPRHRVHRQPLMVTLKAPANIPWRHRLNGGKVQDG